MKKITIENKSYLGDNFNKNNTIPKFTQMPKLIQNYENIKYILKL